MKKQNTLKLEQEIWKLQKKLRELKPYIEINHSVAVVYNRTLVEKAVLVDKLNKIINRPTFMQKIKKVFTFKTKKKLICDYFHE